MIPIIDGVYLGNREAARDLRELKREGITHVVNCTEELPNYHEGTLTYLSMKLTDPDPTFYRWLGQTRTFIDDGRKGGKVLVHCFAAVSRSPATILAYLCYAEKLTLEQASRKLADLAWTAPDVMFLRQIADNLGEDFDDARSEQLTRILMGRG